jgi:GT2 family glycosyltransferase
MIDLSVVLVTYRSSPIAGEAVTSVRAAARACAISCEIIVVDHSEDPAEAGRLAGFRADRLITQANRGYAAGINTGVGASQGERIVVGNPDLTVSGGALAALLGALERGWDVVGPRFCIGDFMLPPADEQTLGAEWRRWRAGRSYRAGQRYFRSEVRRWLEWWRGDTVRSSPFLSGALLAFDRRTWDRVGPWDEGYFLYFEESDWLVRACARGLRVALVPGARVEHRWAHAADTALCAAHFAASRRRYFTRHYGWPGRVVASLPAHGHSLLSPVPLPSALRLAATEVLWLASPSPFGYPAGGVLGGATPPWQALATVAARRAAGAAYTVLAVDPLSIDLLGAWLWRH